MKLLLIYGSPAVGKLTVAREIAARTGLKVFHNHLSIDAIEPVFEFGSKSFGKLINLIRYETIREAALEKVDLIYTFCYAKGLDDDHIRKVANIVEENGGEVCLVLLKADRAELKQRVTQESRKKLGKIKTVELIDYYHDKYDLCSPFPERESLIIDNTNFSPDQAARRIIEHYNLAKPAN